MRAVSVPQHSWCCNLSATRFDGPGTGKDTDRVSYSNWIREYWARAAGFQPDYHSLRGWGLVAANPRKRWRSDPRREPNRLSALSWWISLCCVSLCLPWGP